MLRNLDGVYFRINRNGKWENICFSDMTEEEMNSVLANREVDWLKSLCIYLGQTIQSIGKECDIVCDL